MMWEGIAGCLLIIRVEGRWGLGGFGLRLLVGSAIPATRVFRGCLIRFLKHLWRREGDAAVPKPVPASRSTNDASFASPKSSVFAPKNQLLSLTDPLAPVKLTKQGRLVIPSLHISWAKVLDELDRHTRIDSIGPAAFLSHSQEVVIVSMANATALIWNSDCGLFPDMDKPHA